MERERQLYVCKRHSFDWELLARLGMQLIKSFDIKVTIEHDAFGAGRGRLQNLFYLLLLIFLYNLFLNLLQFIVVNSNNILTIGDEYGDRPGPLFGWWGRGPSACWKR